MKRKILYMYHTSTIGGGSYCLLNILKGLDRDKYTPIVLLREDGPLVKAIDALDIKVFFMPLMRLVPYNKSPITPSKILNAISLISSFKQFKQMIEEISPDIVYVNTMMMYPYLRIAKEEGFKTIIHIREHWPVNEHKWQRKTAINHIIKYADKIVAINSFSASMVENSKNNVTVVYDWIDMYSRYEYIPYSKLLKEDASNLKVYLYTGGLQKIKGVREVLRAFSSEIKGENRRLIVMGINPHPNRKGLRGLIKNTLLKVGYKTYSEEIYELIKSDKRIVCVPGTYNMSHILKQAYCVVSYFTIPHANLALAESIIMNTLTLAASTPESVEYSYNGQLSELYEINNYKEFVAKWKIIDSFDSPIKVKIHINSHYVTEMFDPQTNIMKLSQIYEEL